MNQLDVPTLARRIGRDEKALYRSVRATRILLVDLVAANPDEAICWIAEAIKEGIRGKVDRYTRDAARERLHELLPEQWPRPTQRDIEQRLENVKWPKD